MTPSTFIKLTEAVDLDAEQRDRDAETHIMNDATDCQYHVDSGEVKTLNNISMRTFVSRVRSRDPEIWGSISLNGRPVRYIDGRFECGRHTLWINQPTNWHPIAPILMSPRRLRNLSGGGWRSRSPFFGTMTEAVDFNPRPGESVRVTPGSVPNEWRVDGALSTTRVAGTVTLHHGGGMEYASDDGSLLDQEAYDTLVDIMGDADPSWHGLAEGDGQPGFDVPPDVEPNATCNGQPCISLRDQPWAEAERIITQAWDAGYHSATIDDAVMLTRDGAAFPNLSAMLGYCKVWWDDGMSTI